MRIMHVITQRQLRGAEIFASQLSDVFVREGHQVIIVGLRTASNFPRNPAVEYVDLNIDESSRFFAFDAWKRFSALVSKWKPDVIQANASETLKFTVFSKLLFRWKAPLVYRNANKVSDFLKSRAGKIFNRALVRYVNHVISVSENCRVDFANTFGVPLSKITTVPIGTVLDHRKSSGMKSIGKYWINVASLVPEKNHSGLLSIYSQYRKQGGEAELYIVGDGKLRANLESLSEQLGINNSVKFLGYRNDALGLIANSRGLVLPSLIEGLPGVILEAMSVAVPVVVYGVGGIPEVVHNRVNGVLVEKGDESSFVQGILELENDTTFRTDVATAGFVSCVNNFDISKIAHRFLDSYKQVTKILD